MTELLIGTFVFVAATFGDVILYCRTPWAYRSQYRACYRWLPMSGYVVFWKYKRATAAIGQPKEQP